MAVQGFKYSLIWASDFKEVDNAPAGFTNRSARTKADVTLDPKMQAKRDPGGKDYYFVPSTVIVIIKPNVTESWVLKGMQSDKLLKHEQMHYNISALAGRDLEKKLLELRDPSGPNLLKRKEDLGKEMQALIDKINKDYDEGLQGTDHGKKDAEQSKWEIHINGLMNKENAELKTL